MKKLISFLLGLLSGAIVGGGLAILFAPTSGEATRQRIEESYSHVRNEVKSAALNKSNELKAELARLQKKVIPE